MSKDILLGADHDLVIENFDLVLTDDTQGLRQRVKQKLLCFKGEWFFDENIGTEYFDAISDKNTENLVSILTDSIREVRGVKEVTSFDVKLEPIKRTLEISFEVSNDLDETISDTITIANI